MPSKKTVIITVVILAISAIVAGFLLWFSSPQRTLEAFMEAIESGDQEKAMTFVSTTLKESKKGNIEWFVEDWVIADSLEWALTTDESWRSRAKTTEENGETVTVLNKYGNEDREIKPTPKYFAHHYQAYVDVAFDDFEDPVIIKLKRRTDDTWSLFSQVFRGWQVTQIRYQPFDEEDYEDIEFETDDEGNFIPVDDAVDEGEEDSAEGAEDADSGEGDDDDALDEGLVEPPANTNSDVEE